MKTRFLASVSLALFIVSFLLFNTEGFGQNASPALTQFPIGGNKMPGGIAFHLKSPPSEFCVISYQDDLLIGGKKDVPVEPFAVNGTICSRFGKDFGVTAIIFLGESSTILPIGGKENPAPPFPPIVGCQIGDNITSKAGIRLRKPQELLHFAVT